MPERDELDTPESVIARAIMPAHTTVVIGSDFEALDIAQRVIRDLRDANLYIVERRG